MFLRSRRRSKDGKEHTISTKVLKVPENADQLSEKELEEAIAENRRQAQRRPRWQSLRAYLVINCTLCNRELGNGNTNSRR